MTRCITCGDELHPERAEKYSYCTKRECQEANRRGLPMVSVGVNKSADQFEVLDEHTREELASGKHHDPRRGSYGPVPGPPPGRPPGQDAKAPSQAAEAKPRRPVRRASRPPWTRSQLKLALLYHEQGMRPDEIAEKLGLSRYTVTQMILKAPRRPRG
jgi:DNA-binding CsgD family transcriptional regulator